MGHESTQCGTEEGGHGRMWDGCSLLLRLYVCWRDRRRWPWSDVGWLFDGGHMMGVPWSDGTVWNAGWGQEVLQEIVGNMNINVNLMWPFGQCATGPKIKFKTGLV
jgi:hypothetical protein